ncbi:MAG TPA: type II toxin-antitoxin system RelE/ParE family toxin [Xanthobacteraceae bacterium]|nr:type II toxin-antitoxin system RelE/ParE family toxin [Xanthobacteraceae bacterium]
MKRITFTPRATTQWLKLSQDVRRRVNGRLEQFAATGHGDVKRLKRRAGARLRVGDWRVIFYEERDVIVVTAVGHRREIYN